MNNMPCRKPAGPYLIESAPNYLRYMAAKSAREIAQRILSPLAICAAGAQGYQSELCKMLNAQAIYLGPGK